jgi:hypothetical protein
MHPIFRTLALLLMVAFAAVSFDSRAQATQAPDEVKNPPAKSQPANKAEPPKAGAPKKVGAKSTAAKTAAKPEVATPKTPVTTSGISPNPDFTVYKAGQSPPNLQGKDGKVIPSNPDAYDVSSGTGKKK